MTEEASALKIPFLTARYLSDRPETDTAGTNIVTGLEKDSVTEKVRKVMNDAEFRKAMFSKPSPYGDGNSSKKIMTFPRNSTMQAIYYFLKRQ